MAIDAELVQRLALQFAGIDVDDEHAGALAGAFDALQDGFARMPRDQLVGVEPPEPLDPPARSL